MVVVVDVVVIVVVIIIVVIIVIVVVVIVVDHLKSFQHSDFRRSKIRRDGPTDTTSYRDA